MPTSYKKIRQQHATRLSNLFITLLYGEQFKLYISDIGGTYRPDYQLDFDRMSYQGQFAFVELGDDDYLLCMLHSTEHADTYRATEVPFAFARIPTRCLSVNVSTIMCVLEPC